MYEQIKTEMEAWLKDYDNIFQLQEEFLFSLLHKFQDTAVGKEKNYASIKSIEQFQEQTSIQHYSDLKPYIDRTIAGEINILHPDPPTCWIHTSGTTGTPKIFPYNQDYIKNWFGSASAIKNCFIYRVGSKALKMLEGEALLMHASRDYGTIGTGITRKPLASVSGWAARQSSPEHPFAPPLNIQLIQDWQERILQTAVYYVQRNLTRLSGVTTYFLSFLEELEKAFDGRLFIDLAEKNPERALELKQFYEEDGKLKIPRIWPNLFCLNFGGVNPYKYQRCIEEILPESIIFQSFVGSEGFYGFQYDIGHPAMVLVPKNAFYEFLDVEEYNQWKFQNGTTPTRHTVADVKVGKEYVFCISNYLGFTTYITGDIIQIVSTKPLLFLHSRRLSKEINLSAEKMSENHITVAINEAFEKNQCVYREYMCIAIAEPHPHYAIAIDFFIPPKSIEQLATDLEESIGRSNLVYKELRKIGILKPLQVINLPAGEFDRYILAKTKAGQWNPGQMKLLRLTDSQDFIHFLRSRDKNIARL